MIINRSLLIRLIFFFSFSHLRLSVRFGFFAGSQPFNQSLFLAFIYFYKELFNIGRHVVIKGLFFLECIGSSACR